MQEARDEDVLDEDEEEEKREPAPQAAAVSSRAASLRSPGRVDAGGGAVEPRAGRPSRPCLQARRPKCGELVSRGRGTGSTTSSTVFGPMGGITLRRRGMELTCRDEPSSRRGRARSRQEPTARLRPARGTNAFIATGVVVGARHRPRSVVAASRRRAARSSSRCSWRAPAPGRELRRAPRRCAGACATAIVFFLAAVIAVAVGYLLVHPVYTSATSFAKELPSLVRQAQHGKGQIGRLVKRLHLESYVQKNVPRPRDLDQPASAAGPRRSARPS